MFFTPPAKKMATRSAVRKEQDRLRSEKTDQRTPSVAAAASGISNTRGVGEPSVKSDKLAILEAGSVKFEVPQPGVSHAEVPVAHSSKSVSKRSITSSMAARRKRLEAEAAEAKSRIQMELIDKRLAADLAELDEDYHSPPSFTDNRSAVEKWMERSQRELETQHIEKPKEPAGLLCPPAPVDAGTDGPIQQLALVLKDMMTTNVSNNNILSRMSTPKELPLFAGDPMDWLQFKAAYEESTRVCNFSDSENLWRLRKCLRGPARDAVTALLITATSPDTLMSTLELQFGNPDEILSRIMLDIKRLHNVSPDYHKDIVVFSNKIKNYVAAVRALGCDEFLQGTSLVTVVLSKLPTILLSKWADYKFTRDTSSSTSRLDLLSQFLHEEALKMSQCSVTLLNTPKDSYRRKHYGENSGYHSQTVLLHSEQSDVVKCRFCRGSNHNLTDCKKFKKSMRKDRWRHVKRYGLCYKCLLSHHNKQNCPAPLCDVNNCSQAHHRLLHFVPSERQSSDNSTVQVTEIETQTDSEVVAHVNINSQCKVLLKVIPINIHGPNGIIKTSCLLDDGSSVTLISNELAERAGLRGRRECMRVRGAWDNTELVCETYLLDLSLSNMDGDLFTIGARSVNKLNLPNQNMNFVNCGNYAHLKNIKEHLCNDQLKPEILIGQDNYHLLLPLEVVTGTPQEPCATRTPLGWCLHGRAPLRVTSPASPLHSILMITGNDVSDDVTEDRRLLRELHEDVQRSFTFDSLGVGSKPRLNHDEERAREQLEQTSSLVNGRWYVGLPWKDENCLMPDSYPHALSRLKSVEQKMKKSEEYAEKYRDRVQHLFDNDYAQRMSDTEATNKIWYLPHFGVENPNKKKLRLVFDAAAKTNGFSLNDYLLKGPDLLKSLFGIMLRFREHKVAVTGDIKDMFLRVKIRPEDQNALRFLYRNEPESKIETYVMTSLIFGANCSPFIAQFIKNKNAQRFETEMSTACEAIYNQHYMDDYIDSLPDVNTAIKLIQEITTIHKQGGFEIRNWTCNMKEVLETIPKETLGEAAVRFKIGGQYESERTLGLIWFPHEDTLSFDVSFKKISEDIINGKRRPTKRDMLRVVMSIFDVYGFLSPFTINGKIILQECWERDLDWDMPIPNEIYEKWCKWISCLQTLRNIKLPRYYYNAATPASGTGGSEPVISQPAPRHDAHALPSPIPITSQIQSDNAACYKNLQLHMFCDASSKAMCAVAYWRWEEDAEVKQAFIASKCRVASNKTTSIARLELQGAILAARLADNILKEHNLKATRKIYWCDSTTVLHWIRNKCRSYKVYIANRLGELDELTSADEWRYVPTKLNVADVGTRETYDLSILQGEWLQGPTFLSCDERAWPKDVLQPEINEDVLERLYMIQNEHNDLPVPEPTRFSSWLRLLRTTAVVLTFINKCRKITKDRSDVMEDAERLLLKHSQAQSFEDEINNLKKGKQLPRSSRLLTLSPYLEDGVLRAQGRIDAAAGVSCEVKRPVILDGREYITRLIVRYYHIQAAHHNQETVVNNLKQKYWIIKVRLTVKTVVSKCMTCKINKCKPEIPRMGDLPQARMAHHQRPFTFSGIDLFGPLEVTIGRRREKRYGVIFTCMTVRAVHLETVATLTSDSLIMALRRMAARRGWPHNIFSDNGTNLRGADTELKKAILELDEEALRDEAMNRGTRWTFIPAGSPHWAGAWERLIRTIKASLKAVLKERAPREETFNTLMAEVENIVNSRPLTHVSVDPGAEDTLTPNHFLLGSASTSPQMGVFDDDEFRLRKQWRISQRLADLYWSRWVKEVLPELIPRKKWHEEQRSLRVGDLVFIVDPNGPRNVWPRGRVERVLPGRDGRTRMVQVKTKNGVLTRAAARVARLPVAEECC